MVWGETAERNLTTTVSKINAKDVEEMQAAGIDRALQAYGTVWTSLPHQWW